MTVGVLTELLNAFIGAFAGGFDRLKPAIGALFSLLVSIDVLYLGFLVLLDIEPPVKGGLRKLFTLTAWAFVVQNFDTLAADLVSSLAQGGLIAAGHGSDDPRVLMNPSAILNLGFQATQPLTQAISEASLLSVWGTLGVIVLSYILIMLAYIVIAITLLITMIEYYIALAITGLLLPFGVFSPTRWIAMKPLSYFLSCGLKVMVLAFLMAISHDVLARAYFASQEPTMRELWIGACAALCIAMLAWFGPRGLAGGIMAGSASLGASDAVGFAAGAVMAASRGGAGARAPSGGQGRSGPVAPPAPVGVGHVPPPAGAVVRTAPHGAGASAGSASPVASAMTRATASASAPIFVNQNSRQP